MATNLNDAIAPKHTLKELAVAMLLLDLKRTEDRAEKEGWIGSDDLERELGLLD